MVSLKARGRDGGRGLAETRTAMANDDNVSKFEGVPLALVLGDRPRLDLPHQAV